MNHLNFKCSSNDSSCPCIKCIENEEVGSKSLSEVQVFHLTAKLLNIQVFTVKRDIGAATSESEGGYLKENFAKKKNGTRCAVCCLSYTQGKSDSPSGETRGETPFQLILTGLIFQIISSVCSSWCL